MSVKAFCVHGHFYQPPREDPLTGIIPIETGAAPYNNWNEKINAECYRPNAELGNYRKISYNFGPTLLTWIADHDPTTYSKIISQDKENYEHYGVGNAMAQSYHHTILPLGNRLDKITQIRWGIADFIYRYGHKPLGLWLPETAVNLETLTILADQGIEFTLLAPWQAKNRIPVSSLPYWVRLPGNRRIAVFFYHQDLSTRLSFDPGATINADSFFQYKVMPIYDTDMSVDEPQLTLLASDGELYGHHQKFRDQFLAHLLNGASHNQGVELTFPGLWLKNHPPQREIKIRENTSWSCHHGIARWSQGCDCTPGSTWKGSFRKALSQLGALIDNHYFNVMTRWFTDPWEIRHQYIQVVLEKIAIDDFILSLANRSPDKDDIQKIKYLLSAQFERQRMYTSCGWFFDELDRIEPKNNIAYSAHAIWLTQKATGVDLRKQAIELLKKVKSTRSGISGDRVFLQKYAQARKTDTY
jgi:hypothetical protein